MLDFTGLPKQWLIAPELADDPVAGKRDAFAGWQIAAAQAVPILRLCDAAGAQVGRLIGWVIDGADFHRADGTLTLADGEPPEDRFARLAGRFVMLWRGGDGRVRLREDAAGGLPAIHAPEMRAVGATVTALDQLGTLPVDPDIEAIFDFPARRGFLPFGLTPRRGARRLMPSHELTLDDFITARIWPDSALCTRPELNEVQIARLVDEAAEILRRHLAALLGQGETVLYLSGGNDSRIILAAARGSDRLRAETLGDARTLEVHVAARVARRAGLAHRAVPVLPTADADVAAWLSRSGRMMYDPVTHLATTAVANDPGTQPLTGTGAELTRATNWTAEDAAQPVLDLPRLLARVRMPDDPRIRRAGQDWLDVLPSADAAMALDLAKIEQIHGCWSGAAVYGHPLARPSMSPFSGQRLNTIALALPTSYRLANGFFPDVMRRLWPDLLEVPVNRASGLTRLRFWKSEARHLVPAGVKRALKPLR